MFQVVLSAAMIWSEKDDAFLKRNYKLLSPARIGTALKVARSAVIERCQELGLDVQKGRFGTTSSIQGDHRLEFGPISFDDGSFFMARAGTKEMDALRADECRWPCGDEFCSAKALTGKSYCREHDRIAHRKDE